VAASTAATAKPAGLARQRDGEAEPPHGKNPGRRDEDDGQADGQLRPDHPDRAGRSGGQPSQDPPFPVARHLNRQPLDPERDADERDDDRFVDGRERKPVDSGG